MAGDGSAPVEASKTTRYIVQVKRPMGQDSEGEGPLWIAWEDRDEFEVPRRTQRATVRRRAGELVAVRMGEGDTGPIEFRVLPAGEVLGGQVELEVPEPQLKVTEL